MAPVASTSATTGGGVESQCRYRRKGDGLVSIYARVMVCALVYISGDGEGVKSGPRRLSQVCFVVWQLRAAAPLIAGAEWMLRAVKT